MMTDELGSGGVSEPEILPAGDRALLLVPGAHDRLAAVVDAVRRADLAGVEDVLPAAETVLVTVQAGALDMVDRELRLLLRGPLVGRSGVDETEEVVISVRYDGEDLAEVAALLNMTIDAVIAAHTGRVWRCRFVGFTAGFGYLESNEPGLSVPRRHQSRTAVPSGAVALADGYSAVYPRRTPGGWQLIGTTDLPMWDVGRPRPALLSPGTRVRFVQAGDR